jgi:hypothetical protein
MATIRLDLETTLAAVNGQVNVISAASAANSGTTRFITAAAAWGGKADG